MVESKEERLYGDAPGAINLNNPVTIVFVGKTQSGKTTLMNALARKELGQ